MVEWLSVYTLIRWMQVQIPEWIHVFVRMMGGPLHV